MYALIDTENKVIQVQETIFDVHPSFVWVNCPEDCKVGWDYLNGEVSAPIIAQKSFEELLIEYNFALQDFIDSVAKQKNYESSLHCATYANSTNLVWKADAETFIAWRDAVWTYGYAELAAIEGGAPVPTLENFIAAAPQINW